MQIAVISFTKNGKELADKIAGCLSEEGYEVTADIKCNGARGSITESLGEWTGRMFQKCYALIYVGAAGIAVRAIAPYVESKTSDPAVLVADEKGSYIIPVLSGHIGGANELAVSLAAGIGGSPVITTATDIHHLWAVDKFAQENHLWIADMAKAKRISARLLAGEEIIVDRTCEENRIKGEPPEGIRMVDSQSQEKEPDICIGIHKNPSWRHTLYLVPRAAVVGIGCRKGTDAGKIEKAIERTLNREGIFQSSLCKLASIDIKAGEEGILRYCRNHSLELETYSAGELLKAEGGFHASAFVEKITGIDNVCERSAVYASGNGRLVVEKQVDDGVTVAVAQRDWRIIFE